jgi:hypothetical protein
LTDLYIYLILLKVQYMDGVFSPMFRRSQPPPSSAGNGFPPDSVIVIVPRVLIERLMTLAIALALGGTIQVTLYVWTSAGSQSSAQSGSKR